MTITGGSALPKDDIQQMVEDAEKYAEEDRRRREAVEVRNRADQLVYQTDKTLKDQGEKLDAALTAEIEEALTGLKDALKGDDTDAVRSGMEALGGLSQRLAEAIYHASAAGTDGSDGGGDDTGDTGDDVDDAEIVDAEVVDEGDDQAAAS